MVYAAGGFQEDYEKFYKREREETSRIAAERAGEIAEKFKEEVERLLKSGAVPWVSESEKQNWEMQQQGFTWQMSNGTRGFGRPAANTVEEAKEVANKINKGKPYKVRV